jgi:hypothetical protein
LVYLSPVAIPEGKTGTIDAMTFSMKEMFNFIFLPFDLLRRMGHKMM